MQCMEAPHEHISQTLPNPERPPVAPHIVTISSPEEQHLPYRVEIDPDKLGDFMRSLGMQDSQIRDTTLTIAYDTRGQDPVTKFFDPMGSVNPFTGNLTINPRTFMNHVESMRRLFENNLKHGSTPDMVETEVSARRLGRKFMGLVLPEFTEPDQVEAFRELSPVWRTRYADLAHNTGEQKRARAYMEQHITRIIEHNLRLVLPHELIHVEQVKSGRSWAMASRAIPLVISYACLNLSLSYGMRLLRLVMPAANRFPIKTLLGISEFGLQTGLLLHTIREGRKATGIEKEAYTRMKDYDDLFTDIVRLVPVEEARPREEYSAQHDYT